MRNEAQGARQRRALLWAIYFMLVALVDAPGFMLDWSTELGDHLDASDRSRIAEPSRSRLRRVK